MLLSYPLHPVTLLIGSLPEPLGMLRERADKRGNEEQGGARRARPSPTQQSLTLSVVVLTHRCRLHTTTQYTVIIPSLSVVFRIRLR